MAHSSECKLSVAVAHCRQTDGRTDICPVPPCGAGHLTTAIHLLLLTLLPACCTGSGDLSQRSYRQLIPFVNSKLFENTLKYLVTFEIRIIREHFKLVLYYFSLVYVVS